MNLSISRSSVLTWIVFAILLAAFPFAVWEFIKTGEFYLFSPLFLRHMVARLSGPGRLRFIFQPTAAILLGARDGVKDARAGDPPFLSALLFYRTGQAGLLGSAVGSVRNLVA